MKTYFDDFRSKEDLEREFEVKLDADVNILFAAYRYEDYYGSAYAIFEKDGKIYDVVGSHCSCYGLEGQWEPNETTAEAIRSYVLSATWKVGHFTEETRQALNDIVALL